MADLTAYTGVLGERLAAHLLRRTTLGATKADIQNFALKTPSQALDDLLNFLPITNKPIDPLTNTTWVDSILPGNATGHSDDTYLRFMVVSWLLDNMRTNLSIRSKMQLFLHQNWIVTLEVLSGYSSYYLYDHIQLLTFYHLGSYKTLAKKMCRDNALLVFLNGNDNNRIVPTYPFVDNNKIPNENFAREFLELFTIGKGPQIAPGNYTNYTEEDIKAAAKVLSGYKIIDQYNFPNNGVDLIDPETGIRRCQVGPVPVSYDTNGHFIGPKIFSNAFGNAVINVCADEASNTIANMEAELNQFIDMVFDQPETAKNICRKLYRFFVYRNISTDVEANIITPLAIALKSSNYNLSVALRQLLASKHFYDLDDANATNNRVGAIVKSPLDLMMNTLRFFDISPFQLSTNPYSVWYEFYKHSVCDFFCKTSDMNVFDPPTVAGYAAYYLAPKYDRNWFGTSSITQRYYLGKCLLENTKHPFGVYQGDFGAQIDFLIWVRTHISDPSDGNKVVDEIINYLYPEIPDADRRAYFLNNVFLGSLSLTNWRNEWNNYISSGNDTVVRQRVNLLFQTVLFAQEYQLQ
jgi:uncharacterized protein (DUF1800 family)